MEPALAGDHGEGDHPARAGAYGELVPLAIADTMTVTADPQITRNSTPPQKEPSALKRQVRNRRRVPVAR